MASAAPPAPPPHVPAGDVYWPPPPPNRWSGTGPVPGYASCSDLFPSAPFGLDFIPPWTPYLPALQAIFATQGEQAAVDAAVTDFRRADNGGYSEWRGCAQSTGLEIKCARGCLMTA